MTKEEAIKFLSEFMERVNTQDNRMTATPYYLTIRTEKWRICHDEYSNGETRTCRRDFNREVTYYSFDELLKDMLEEEDIDRDSAIEEVHKTISKLEEYWEKLEEFTEERYYEDENVFFTEEGYAEHVRLNGHNLDRKGKYYSYGKCAWRNPEILNLLESVGVLVDKPLVKH